MTLDSGNPGVAFSSAADGDVRNDPEAAARFRQRRGIPNEWAWVRQVHGGEVRFARSPQVQGAADAVWTDQVGVPVAVFTADCLGVVLAADGAVGVAHAGWRGTLAGVVPALVDEMLTAGYRPTQAWVGPAILSCCFEVGPEVIDQFDASYQRQTTWGTPSVDLVSMVSDQLGAVPLQSSGSCTFHDQGFFSHRREQAVGRQIAVGWLN